MFPFTAADIRRILDKIGREVVVPATDEFPYEIVSRRSQGYHEDPEISKLQAKLSIMLQVASEREPRSEVKEEEG